MHSTSTELGEPSPLEPVPRAAQPKPMCERLWTLPATGRPRGEEQDKVGSPTAQPMTVAPLLRHPDAPLVQLSRRWYRSMVAVSNVCSVANAVAHRVICRVYKSVGFTRREPFSSAKASSDYCFAPRLRRRC